jgi:hypothetical protein
MPHVRGVGVLLATGVFVVPNGGPVISAVVHGAVDTTANLPRAIVMNLPKVGAVVTGLIPPTRLVVTPALLTPTGLIPELTVVLMPAWLVPVPTVVLTPVPLVPVPTVVLMPVPLVPVPTVVLMPARLVPVPVTVMLARPVAVPAAVLIPAKIIDVLRPLVGALFAASNLEVHKSFDTD